MLWYAQESAFPENNLILNRRPIEESRFTAYLMMDKPATDCHQTANRIYAPSRRMPYRSLTFFNFQMCRQGLAAAPIGRRCNGERSWGWWVGRDRGKRPRRSGDEPGNTLHQQVQDSLLRAGSGQVDEDLPPGLDDPGGQLDQAQAQRVELGDPPA